MDMLNKIKQENLYKLFEKTITNKAFKKINIYCHIMKEENPRSRGSMYKRDNVYIILLYLPLADKYVLLHECAHILMDLTYPALFKEENKHNVYFKKIFYTLIKENISDASYQ